MYLEFRINRMILFQGYIASFALSVSTESLMTNA